MATSKDFLDYFKEQLKDIPDITFKPMMGEYLVYYRGRLVGDICDNTVFLKPVKAAKDLLPSAPMLPPYDGAKDMLVLEDFENPAFVSGLLDAMYAELPEPKKKAKKGTN